MDKLNIAFDFAMLSTPYRMKRCSYQLMHLSIIAERMGHKVKCITNESHLNQHTFVRRLGSKLVHNRDFPIDIYIAKSDAFYIDSNWELIDKLPGFKVCLINSDQTFRETDKPHKTHIGHPVQDRCNLYMPCNHTDNVYKSHGYKMIPAAHPIDPRMYREFRSRRLYYSYLMNDITRIREVYKTDETDTAGFMGNMNPKKTRYKPSQSAPSWCRFEWSRNTSPKQYINWMCSHRGCLDMRGNGDKSLRFSEAALFGRTIICQNLPSKYSPLLKDNHNCILLDNWDQLSDVEYDRDKWLEISEQATQDYCDGWSLHGQMSSIIRRFKNG